MHTLRARNVDYDAVFAVSDLIALGVLHALEEAGVRVPAQVSVAGFDDIPMARFATPALTTVLQDTKLAGEVLVQRLLAQLRGESADSAMLPAQLVIRRSCGAPV
jgi:DNA-binding LacI/PurR family transcriptional regulator